MENKNTHDFAFGKDNYIILIAGIVLITIGYLLMVGGGAEDPNTFSAEEIFSTRRITVAPIVILVGFATVLVAVMKKSKE